MVEGIEPRVKLILLSASPGRDTLSLASGQALDRKLMEERSISNYAEETRSLEPRFSSKLLGKKEDIPHFSL